MGRHKTTPDETKRDETRSVLLRTAVLYEASAPPAVSALRCSAPHCRPFASGEVSLPTVWVAPPALHPSTLAFHFVHSLLDSTFAAFLLASPSPLGSCRCRCRLSSPCARRPCQLFAAAFPDACFTHARRILARFPPVLLATPSPPPPFTPPPPPTPIPPHLPSVPPAKPALLSVYPRDLAFYTGRIRSQRRSDWIHSPSPLPFPR